MLELVIGLLVAVVCLGMVLEPMVRLRPSLSSGATGPDWSDLDEVDSPKVRALTALAEIDFDLCSAPRASLIVRALSSAVSASCGSEVIADDWIPFV